MCAPGEKCGLMGGVLPGAPKNGRFQRKRPFGARRMRRALGSGLVSVSSLLLLPLVRRYLLELSLPSAGHFSSPSRGSWTGTSGTRFGPASGIAKVGYTRGVRESRPRIAERRPPAGARPGLTGECAAELSARGSPASRGARGALHTAVAGLEQCYEGLDKAAKYMFNKG